MYVVTTRVSITCWGSLHKDEGVFVKTFREQVDEAFRWVIQFHLDYNISKPNGRAFLVVEDEHVPEDEVSCLRFVGFIGDLECDGILEVVNAVGPCDILGFEDF